MTDMPCCVASCAVAHAPIAPNVARHSEICPPIPVTTVIDKKMIARIAARTERSTQNPLAWKKR